MSSDMEVYLNSLKNNRVLKGMEIAFLNPEQTSLGGSYKQALIYLLQLINDNMKHDTVFYYGLIVWPELTYRHILVKTLTFIQLSS